MPTLVICRHGERLDYVQGGWTASAARPWDPPLTPKGHDQAALAGAAIAGHLEALRLPPVRMTSLPHASHPTRPQLLRPGEPHLHVGAAALRRDGSGDCRLPRGGGGAGCGGARPGGDHLRELVLQLGHPR